MQRIAMGTPEAALNSLICMYMLLLITDLFQNLSVNGGALGRQEQCIASGKFLCLKYNCEQSVHI